MTEKATKEIMVCDGGGEGAGQIWEDNIFVPADATPDEIDDVITDIVVSCGGYETGTMPIEWRYFDDEDYEVDDYRWHHVNVYVP